MDQFQGQHLGDFNGVVPISLEMVSHDGFEGCELEVRSRKSPRVEQYFPNVSGENISVPDAEMCELVPAKKEPVELERREQMINAGQPLGHTVVVGVFCFECELEEPLRDRRGNTSLVSAQATISPDPVENCIPIGDQPATNLIVRTIRHWRAENRPDQVVV